MNWLRDWKLKLKYGKPKTAFRHFTIIGDGKIVAANPDHCTIEGAAAFFSIKAWAKDSDEAVDMLVAIGRHQGFDATGKIYIYTTDPSQPPEDEPYAYDLNFNQYQRTDGNGGAAPMPPKE